MPGEPILPPPATGIWTMLMKPVLFMVVAPAAVNSGPAWQATQLPWAALAGSPPWPVLM